LKALRLIYTPGVAEVCRHLVAHPEDSLKYTWLGSTVAVVTNGTAVLSLGNIGPLASLPVMEAKAALFKDLAGLNAVPILVRARDVKTFVETVEQIAPSFGGIMLEDIEWPACFAIERELRTQLAIPVLHADQHATAVVVLAAMMKAVSSFDKSPQALRVAIHGAGPTGLSTAQLLHAWGVRSLLMFREDGALWPSQETLSDPSQEEVEAFVNPDRERGRLQELLEKRDVLVSTSGGFHVTPSMVARMGPKAVVLAISNPQPAIAPREALAAGCAFALDGTNLNNALAFPGLFKGALESHAPQFSQAMLLAAAEAIAKAAPEGQLVPDQLDRQLHAKVAGAVAKAFREKQESRTGYRGVAR
jgi:malate dehydrogenase (oxaloacetate-decarboxylating)